MIKLTNTEHWLVEQAWLSPEQHAILTSNQEINYSSFLEKSFASAEYLSSVGIKDGDNVCILSSHSYEFWIIVNALWFLGAVPVPLNSRNTKEEFSWQLKKVDAKFLITFHHTQQLDDLEFVNHISLDKFSFQATTTFHHSTFYLLRSSLILFTSGSTGKPKAVVHTFKSLYESVKAMDSYFPLSSNDLWLSSLPLYHIGGFMVLVRSLLAGCGVAFPDNLKHESIIEASSHFNPTHVSFVSTTIKKFIDDDTEPNTNLKYVFLGGGPLSSKICSQAVDAGFPIVKVYGSTETCSMVAALRSNEVKLKPESVGKSFSEKTEIKIKSTIKNKIEGKQNQKSKECGEILLSSPTLFKEYYNDELSTNAKIVDGFYHTGDYGWFDKEGYLYIDSRREDIIITGGENVSAKEVEEALLLFTEIQDKFVFGIEDESWGQTVCAAIVCKNLSEREIKSRLKEKLAGFKIPKKFFFVENIPRNEMGKAKRIELLQSLNFDEV